MLVAMLAMTVGVVVMLLVVLALARQRSSSRKATHDTYGGDSFGGAWSDDRCTDADNDSGSCDGDGSGDGGGGD